jgi:hypothetical protein
MLLNRQASFARIVLTHGQSHYPIHSQVRCGLLKTTRGGTRRNRVLPGRSLLLQVAALAQGAAVAFGAPMLKRAPPWLVGHLHRRGSRLPGRNPQSQPGARALAGSGSLTRKQAGLGRPRQALGPQLAETGPTDVGSKITGEPGVKMKKVT